MPRHAYFSEPYVVDTPAVAPFGMFYQTLESLRLYAYGAGDGSRHPASGRDARTWVR